MLLASTKLHLFNAIIIAKQFPEYDYHLFYIDQIDEKDSYFKALATWKDNPFITMSIWVTDKKSLWSKIVSKRKAITQIISQTMKLKPQKIIVGNDRKNEVSVLLNRFHRVYQGIEIGYMDDGIHSYLIEKSSFVKYTFLDSFFKTLMYGQRITTPKYIGTGTLIDELYLYRPELRHAYLQSKQTYKLDIEILQTESFQTMIKEIVTDLGIELEEELKGINSVLFLPHPKAIHRDTLEQLVSISTSTAIKLHPRDTLHREYFESKGVKVLDNRLVAELIFLVLDREIKVFGFASTALLMAKWLRPTFAVYSLQFKDLSPSELEQLMQKNGVALLPVQELSVHLKT